jgi:hypothetical protein
MKEETVQIRFKKNPVLVDRALQELQKVLTDNLKWLDYAFGRAFRITSSDEEGKYDYPAFYNGDGEYVSLLPNDNFGNFSWFDIYDPQIIRNSTPSRPAYTLKGALVLWYNIESIYGDAEVLYTEEIKEEVLRLLTSAGILQSSRLVVTEVYERFENIYKGYFYSDEFYGADRHFLLYPYAGLRIEFELNLKTLC